MKKRLYTSVVLQKSYETFGHSRVTFFEHYGEHVANVFGDRGGPTRVWLRGVIVELLERVERRCGRRRRSISIVDADGR